MPLPSPEPSSSCLPLVIHACVERNSVSVTGIPPHNLMRFGACQRISVSSNGCERRPDDCPENQYFSVNFQGWPIIAFFMWVSSFLSRDLVFGSESGNYLRVSPVIFFR